MKTQSIAVVIPCFRAQSHILSVLSKIGSEVTRIYVVDDSCPEKTGEWVKKNSSDPRVTVLFNEKNLGVGGATRKGFLQASLDGAEVIVKMDGDDQMDSSKIMKLVAPILEGRADYTKGNRFYCLEFVKTMPAIRLLGNGVLSFLTKLSSGYWDLMDPTNGFLAIHTKIVQSLSWEKIDSRYFFESDMLFRLHLMNAVVLDIPLPAIYGNEKSNLKISSASFVFFGKHIKRTLKRIIYDYYVRDFNIASVEIIIGLTGFLFGLIYGIYWWCDGLQTHLMTPTGKIMAATIPLVLGFQLLLSALNYDIKAKSSSAIHLSL